MNDRSTPPPLPNGKIDVEEPKKKRSKENLIYPGRIWAKRLGHLLTLALIGFSCFLGLLQNELLEGAKLIADKSAELSQSKITQTRKVLRKVNENWIARRVLQKHGGGRLEKGLKNAQEEIRGYQKTSDNLFLLSKVVLTIIGIFSIKILHSAVWIIYDIKFGPVPRRVIFLCVLVVAFNFYTYFALKHVGLSLMSSLSSEQGSALKSDPRGW